MADREMTNEEAIEILGGIRAFYNIFDEYDEPKYAALSKAIFALKAEPIKHGRWKHHQYGNTAGYYECDNCGKINSYKSNYCPKCGADMRGEK